MALIYSRADVYVEERDLSGIVAAVNTSIGAQVSASRKGRLEPQKFTSVQEYIDARGFPDAQVSFSGYTALAALEEMTQFWDKRAIGAGYTFGGVTLQKKTSQLINLIPAYTSDPRPLDAVPPGQDVDFAAIASATSSQDNLAYFYADGPGSYSAGLALEITSDNLRIPTNVAAADAATVGSIIVGIDVAGSINIGTYQYKVTAVNNVGESLASTYAQVVISVNGTSNYISWDAVPGAKGYRIYGRGTGQFLQIATVGGGDRYYIDYGTITPAGAPPSTATTTPKFTVRVYDDEVSKNQPVEQFDCSLTDFVDGFGRQLELEQAINGVSTKIRVKSNAADFLSGNLPVVYGINKTYMAAGSSGSAVTASNVQAAWDLFSDPDTMDIRILVNAGWTSVAVQQKMISVAQSRKDCFVILDCPADKQSAQAYQDYRNLTLNANTNRAAIYGPDVKINDQYSGKILFVPPSGHVAAVFARTDRVTYPWFAPAGLNRGYLNVLAIRYKYDRGQRDALHDAQCNYIRNMPGLGISVWEERTLQGTLSALSFINVRRMLDTIEIAMSRAQNSNLMEPNDDFTRTQVKSAIEEYLELVKKARGINQYLVIVDSSNNSPIVTGNGQLMVYIIIEPTLPVEKIVLRVSITKQGADFQELIKNGALN